MNIATYQVTPEIHENGFFFFTDCGHKLYSIKGPDSKHGCLCPGCLSSGIETTLYIRGSKEANDYWKGKLNENEQRKKRNCPRL